MDEERNPFTLPSDEEVFRMRDTERKMKAQARERQSKLKVWEKTTGSAVAFKSTKASDLLAGMGGDVDAGQMKRTRALVGAARTVLGSSSRPEPQRKPEKENMAEFIAKKREMFLVQMSLDTKREEIRKLEEKAAMKEAALKKSEQMLEEDAIRFDTFLKENDKKAHDAMKQAERETKLKQDKVGEIKRLNQSIQAVQSDMSKHREALEDCMRFKAFLDGLTPKDFFDAAKADKRARQEERRTGRVAAQLAAWEALKAQRAADFEARKVAEHEALLKKGASKKKAAATVAGMRPPRDPERPRAEEEEPLTSSGEELPMYFAWPQQLVDVFTQLEEQNLFLIQNSQETEQALEELRGDFAATRKTMASKSEALASTIGELRGLIAAEEGKSAQLGKHSAHVKAHPPPPPHAAPGGGKGGGAGVKGEVVLSVAEQQAQVLGALHSKVLEVYQRCGFDVSGGSPSTLFMLSELEARLEDLLAAMDAMPTDYVAKAEKAKDKQRRDRKRLEVQLEQERLQEERNRKSNERSMMAPTKRTGRMVMFRSKPLSRRAVAEDKEEDAAGAHEDDKFFEDDD